MSPIPRHKSVVFNTTFASLSFKDVNAYSLDISQYPQDKKFQNNFFQRYKIYLNYVVFFSIKYHSRVMLEERFSNIK